MVCVFSFSCFCCFVVFLAGCTWIVAGGGLKTGGFFLLFFFFFPPQKQRLQGVSQVLLCTFPLLWFELKIRFVYFAKKKRGKKKVVFFLFIPSKSMPSEMRTMREAFIHEQNCTKPWLCRTTLEVLSPFWGGVGVGVGGGGSVGWTTIEDDKTEHASIWTMCSHRSASAATCRGRGHGGGGGLPFVTDQCTKFCFLPHFCVSLFLFSFLLSGLKPLVSSQTCCCCAVTPGVRKHVNRRDAHFSLFQFDFLFCFFLLLKFSV